MKRESKALRTADVWLFSSGPLGDAAESAGSLEPVPQVAQLMADIGARGHATFGGRLSPDARAFPASAMAKKMSGDWRDDEQVRSWAKEITAELG